MKRLDEGKPHAELLRRLGVATEGLGALVAINGKVVSNSADDAIQKLLAILGQAKALKAYLESCDCAECSQLHGFPEDALLQGTRNFIRDAAAGKLNGISGDQAFAVRLEYVCREVEK